ncbi:MAG: type II toxin-antitoxin system RelE/ParE family toxin [Synergistaceae bacterium]|nr:type II toxin-antitoxin system RelE/ParE family toxin [Synergistaceae bacterium]
MRYKVVFSPHARRMLRRLDPNISLRITGWIREHLEGCENPREYGKPLHGTRRDEWSYRVGDYRIIARIQDDKIIILVTDIGYRREIYKK